MALQRCSSPSLLQCLPPSLFICSNSFQLRIFSKYLASSPTTSSLILGFPTDRFPCILLFITLFGILSSLTLIACNSCILINIERGGSFRAWYISWLCLYASFSIKGPKYCMYNIIFNIISTKKTTPFSIFSALEHGKVIP